jgi:hypothetical protein
MRVAVMGMGLRITPSNETAGLPQSLTVFFVPGFPASCPLGDLRTGRRARRPVVEDVLVELAEARARVDAVVLPQGPGDRLERVQGVGPPTRPLQGEHQELPEPLVGRMLDGLRE